MSEVRSSTPGRESKLEGNGVNYLARTVTSPEPQAPRFQRKWELTEADFNVASAVDVIINQTHISTIHQLRGTVCPKAGNKLGVSF